MDDPHSDFRPSDSAGIEGRFQRYRIDTQMPYEGSLFVSDLSVEKLEIECSKCGRAGWYSVNMLIVRHGPSYRLADLLHDVTDECEHKRSLGTHDTCRAFFPQLRG